MADNIGRHIKGEAERTLWGLAAARCEFSDCNRLLHKSAVTQECVNVAQMAHIYSFAPDGPRGRGPYKDNPAGLNDLPNLMLVCYDCHKKIDQDKKGDRYSPSLLKQWKQSHEARIRRVTGISPSKKSHVLIYGSRIGDEHSPLQYDLAVHAMFPDWYPAEDKPIALSMRCSHDDSLPEFWPTEAAHLKREFERSIRPRVEEGAPNHFSIFSFAPQPLLILLGTLMTDKVPSVVYQLHREPHGWEWQPHPNDFEFIINEPADKSGTPILVVSLSGKIDPGRVTATQSGRLSIWELTIADCHNDFLRSEAQLTMFRQVIRRVMVAIQTSHPEAQALHVFPAMPLSCAVEFGRARMPKADLPWIIHDQNNKHQKFIPTLTIGNHHE